MVAVVVEFWAVAEIVVETKSVLVVANLVTALAAVGAIVGKVTTSPPPLLLLLPLPLTTGGHRRSDVTSIFNVNNAKRRKQTKRNEREKKKITFSLSFFLSLFLSLEFFRLRMRFR